jgi:septal ring-binding cell division protein DamX
VHHFSIQPISRKVVDDYLMFRMRAAGYKGPDVFSAAAVLHIGKASQGLMRRVNILADKALLAAFVENVHKIEARHVQAAIRDSEMVPMRNFLNRKSVSMAGGVALFAATLAGAGWFVGQKTSHLNEATIRPVAASEPVATSPAISQAQAASEVIATSEVVAASTMADSTNGTILPLDRNLTLPSNRLVTTQHSSSPRVATPVETRSAKPVAPVPDAPLLKQRLQATQTALSGPSHGNVSIQLFYTDDIRAERMERFLGRAQRLEKLAEIYIVPIKLNGKDGYRVLYGIYANSEMARAGMDTLPQRYKDAFAPTLYMLENSQNMP